MWSAKSSISSGTWGRRRGRRRERRRGKHVLGRVSNTHSTYHRTTHHAPNSSAAYSISTHRAYTHRAGFLRSSRLLSVPSSECALRTGRPSCGCTCWCSSSACPPLGQGSRAISSELMFPSALSARPMTYLTARLHMLLAVYSQLPLRELFPHRPTRQHQRQLCIQHTGGARRRRHQHVELVRLNAAAPLARVCSPRRLLDELLPALVAVVDVV